MRKNIYIVSVSTYSSFYNNAYTTKAAALKNARAVAKDMSFVSQASWSVTLQGEEFPFAEGAYREGKKLFSC